MPHRTQPNAFARLQQSIDAVLVPRGFSTSQGGLWCAAAEDFAQQFPRLPVSQEPPEGWGSECVDVMVDGTTEDGQRHLAEVRVEVYTLQELLADLDLPGAAERVVALTGESAEGGLKRSTQHPWEDHDGSLTGFQAWPVSSPRRRSSWRSG